MGKGGGCSDDDLVRMIRTKVNGDTVQEVDYDAVTGKREKVWEYINANDKVATKYGTDERGQVTDYWFGYESEQSPGLHFFMRIR